MVKANEIRVGNWVEAGGEIYQATPYTSIIIQREEKIINGIPITEDWLIKFGFKLNENNQFKLFEYSEVPILFNKCLNGWTCDGINFSVNFTNYVHQIQNIYFALTGLELEIKGGNNG